MKNLICLCEKMLWKLAKKLWPTTTPENKGPFRQMQASKGWVPAYYKRENQYTLQVRPQKGYVAIELQSLMVAWAMEKFHHFCYL